MRFVGTAIGNIVAHEAGHFLGSFHVDNFNTVPNLMDQGGNFPLLFGVGPDDVGGTADDRDVDFGARRLQPVRRLPGLREHRGQHEVGTVGTTELSFGADRARRRCP